MRKALEKLKSIRPTWAVDFRADDEGEPQIVVYVYDRPIVEGVRGARNLVGIRSIGLPTRVEGRRVSTIEDWVEAQSRVACA